jgi:hypothetical protein
MDHYAPKSQSLKVDNHASNSWWLEDHCASNSGSLDQDQFLSIGELLENLYCSTRK